MLKLSKDDAKKFFEELYRGKSGDDPIDRGVFYEIATRLIAKSTDQTTVGPTALQALILNYLSGSGTRYKVDSVSIAHISRPGVSALLKSVPNVTLKQLIAEAKKNGYDVDIIGTRKK